MHHPRRLRSRQAGSCAAGLFVLVLLAGLAAFIWWLWVDSGSTPGGAATPAAVALPTRADWVRRAAGVGPNGRLVGAGSLLVGRDDLYHAVGAPSSTQVLGGDVLLYWQCGDGTVQVVVPRAAFEAQGLVAGRLNFY